MGTTDSNGIYYYEDTDAVSPLHTLLNAGQQSVTNAITDVKSKFTVSNRAVYGPVPAAGAKIVKYDDYIAVPINTSTGTSAITWPAFTTITNVQLSLQYPGSVGANAIQVHYSSVGATGCNLVFIGLQGVVVAAGTYLVSVTVTGVRA